MDLLSAVSAAHGRFLAFHLHYNRKKGGLQSAKQSGAEEQGIRPCVWAADEYNFTGMPSAVQKMHGGIKDKRMVNRMFGDVLDTIGFVKERDPEVGAAKEREMGRLRSNIELIASENVVSPAVHAAMGSILTNKYAEGYPGHRYYGGCQFVDEVEELARERACRLFGADHANVQPHSGAQANMAVYFALLQPGDTVMGMNLSHGGHLTPRQSGQYVRKVFSLCPFTAWTMTAFWIMTQCGRSRCGNTPS